MARKSRDDDDKKDEPTRPLDGDFDTPFSQPADVKQRMPDDDPRKDSKAESAEEYDEGEDDASSDDNPYSKKHASGDRPHRAF